MKYLFTTALIVGLASCGTTTDECCDTDNTTDQVDCHPTDSTGGFLPDSVVIQNYLNVDSIANVSDLLDTLAAYEPSAKMTH
ncbi:hypothetical protein N8580_00405 [Akkermansiaceae bacterium]|jgi:hypothetical protein|nr:hypothetical protein [Akkermansiaceae bacterium]